ncbi:MAG: hypothetical protein HRU33_23095 [Rhodobacteraceae bacterium]|nr:hypothetical protein [Paracoccaceae bacterium]
MTLSRDDLSIIEGDARVSDKRLKEAPGITGIQVIHRLIDRHSEELNRYEIVISQTDYKTGPGRPRIRYLLNEEKALLVCMFSRTERAREARRQLIEVFLATQRGTLHSLATQQQQIPDILAASAARSDHPAKYLRNIRSMDDLVSQVAYLPIFPSGKLSPWWPDLEVRDFLIQSYRQMGCSMAARIGKERFGGRCPGKSTIHKYWLRLDRVFGLQNPKRRSVKLIQEDAA